MFKASYQYIKNHYKSTLVTMEILLYIKSKLSVQLNVKHEIIIEKISYTIVTKNLKEKKTENNF